MSDSTKYCVTAIVCVLIISGGYVFVNYGKDNERARCDLSVENSQQQDEDMPQSSWDAMSPEEREFQSNATEFIKALAELKKVSVSATSSRNQPRTNSVPPIPFAKMPEISISDISGTGDSLMNVVEED